MTHSEKRFAGNPTKEKQRKTVNDKGNKKKATKMKDNEEKAAALDKVVKDAKGKVAATESTPDKGISTAGTSAPALNDSSATAKPDLQENQDGSFVDEERDAEDSVYPDDEGEEVDDSEGEPEDTDNESDDEATHLLQNAQQDVDRYGNIKEEQKSDDVRPQSGQAMGDSAASTVPFAASSQLHAPAYPPLPGSIGRRRQVRDMSLEEGHHSSIMPSIEHESYCPFYAGGVVSENDHDQYIDDANGNDRGSLQLPNQPVNYPEHRLHQHTSPSPPEPPSEIGFVKEEEIPQSVVTTSHIAPMRLNTSTSGAGGGAQNNSNPQDSTNSSCSRAIRNRHSSEDGSETQAGAPPRRRPRL